MSQEISPVFEQHEKRMNSVISKIYIFLCLVPIFVCAMTYAGLYNYPKKLAVLCVILDFVWALVLILYQKLKLPYTGFKYIVVFAIQSVVFLYSVDVNIQITVLYFLAPMFALLYFKPHFITITCIVAALSMLAGTCISAVQATEVIWHDVTPAMYIITTGGSRFLELLFASVIFISVNIVARKMMISIERRNEKIDTMQNSLVYSFADMIESRDGTTGEHVKRTSLTVSLIVEYLKAHEASFKYKLTPHDYELIVLAAPLHDIGKMKVPDVILSKKGKLTPDEFDIIKTHSSEGAKIIDRTMGGIENPQFLKIARDMALFHHEKWNGQGYPAGLVSTEIPVAARIMAVADVFDALCSARSYKEAFTIDEAFKIMDDSKGSHFEPELVDVLKKLRPQLERIYE